MILAGDIGGTRTRMGLFERSGGRLEPLWKHAVLNAGHASLEAVLAGCERLRGARIEAACFGAAGMVEDGVCRMTNLDWTLDAAALSAGAGIGRVAVVNDLAAIALGIAHLPEDAFAVLQPGTRPWGAASMAVVAPGTGLGEAGLLWDGARHLVVPSEAGHTDFAPGDALQAELRAHLAGDGVHVSYERVLSGPGLVAIAAFLVASGRHEWPPGLAAARPEERPALLAARGLAGDCALGTATLDLFADVLAQEGGNAGLRYLALGGICFAGGIPPAVLPVLRRPAFIERLTGKGRMAELLRSMPVKVSMEPDAGLVGAARIAADLLEGRST